MNTPTHTGSEPVRWDDAGTAHSDRFDDVYHSASGALAQARHVFLAGCDLPQAWASRQQWRILETGFGLGLNFLATWLAWKNDAARPRMLHYVSVEAYPVNAQDVLRAATPCPELQALAGQLAQQWHGLLPGFHRLEFEGGRVLLSLCVGDVQDMLRVQHFEADSIFLDGFNPQTNPDMWSGHTLKQVTRFAHQGTQVATWTVARAVRDALTQNGFQVEKVAGLPPKRDCLRGTYTPPWTPRKRIATPPTREHPGHCAVVGAGLAGAAVAASLARRGWQVTVVDAAARPATGASGAPAGIFAPHVSPDDALLSRLTRAGIRIVWQHMQRMMHDESEWGGTGVVERRPEKPRLPPEWASASAQSGANESWLADAAHLTYSELAPDTPALIHRCAGWVRLPYLVQHWLLTPGVTFMGNTRIAQLEQGDEGWMLLDEAGFVRVQAERVVVAAGLHSAGLIPGLPLQAVRGQLAWGRMGSATDKPLPAVAMNGNGHLITHIPDVDGPLWLTGSTYGRDDTSTALREEETRANWQRLRRLHPVAAAALEDAFAHGRVHAYAGTRCASRDRRPLLGEPLPQTMPGVWLSAALGSRGLSFAALCAEIIAAHWHGEPLPIPAKMAQALDVARQMPQ